MLLGEVIEVESGKRSDRPKLAEALLTCQRTGATLLIAKLDRLSRDAHFLLGLQRAGTAFKALDVPSADNFSVGWQGQDSLWEGHATKFAPNGTPSPITTGFTGGGMEGGSFGLAVDDDSGRWADHGTDLGAGSGRGHALFFDQESD